MDLSNYTDKALDLGRKLLDGALDAGKKAAESALQLAGKAAGKASGYVRRKASDTAKRTGAAVKRKASEQSSALLLLGIVFSCLALLAFALRAYGRRN